MNKKLFYGTTVLSALVVGGYVYYRYNQAKVLDSLQTLEDKARALGLFLDDKSDDEETPREEQTSG